MKLSLLSFALLQGVIATHSKDFAVVKRAGIAYKTTGTLGEPHGFPFNDVRYTKDNARIRKIELSGCDEGSHLGYLGTTFGHPPQSSYHFPNHPATPAPSPDVLSNYGTKGGGDASLALEEGEFVTQVDVATFMAKTGAFHRSRRTRVGWLKFTTNKGHTVTCGSTNAKDNSKSWYFDGYALMYFTGSFGAAIDAISATFIPIENYFVG